MSVLRAALRQGERNVLCEFRGALEGKFSVKNKSPGHPHTNMAKAALNMMTHTSCKDCLASKNELELGLLAIGPGHVSTAHSDELCQQLNSDKKAGNAGSDAISRIEICAITVGAA